MQLPSLSRQQVRQVDQIAIETFRVPGIVLMENAGRGAAEIIDDRAVPGPVLILCGSGNNGGDGYVVARHLQLAGREVRIVSIVEWDRLQGDAKINAEIVRRSEIDVKVVQDAEEIAECVGGVPTIVDALLGTGARGSLRGIYAQAVEAANGSVSMRFALDLPTGLDCDTGDCSDPTFRADHTITFVAPKIGFHTDDAVKHVGEVHVVSIGAPKKLLEQFLLRKS